MAQLLSAHIDAAFTSDPALVTRFPNAAASAIVATAPWPSQHHQMPHAPAHRIPPSIPRCAASPTTNTVA